MTENRAKKLDMLLRGTAPSWNSEGAIVSICPDSCKPTDLGCSREKTGVCEVQDVLPSSRIQMFE